MTEVRVYRSMGPDILITFVIFKMRHEVAVQLSTFVAAVSGYGFFLKHQNLVSAEQYGFQPGRPIKLVTTDVVTYFHAGEAFDSLLHSRMKQLIEQVGFTGKAYDGTKTNGPAIKGVVLKGESYGWKFVFGDILKCSDLRPILFTLYGSLLPGLLLPP